MASSLNSPFMSSPFHTFPSNFKYISHPPLKFPSKLPLPQFYPCTKFHISSSSSSSSSSYRFPHKVLHKCCVPFAVSLVIFWSNPAQAGFLSGITGIESVPGPELPSVDFLNRFNEENQKRYAANDERIKSSPIIKQLLERSKQNKDKNKQEIMDKYCLRGAEWGVGDCSTQAMTAEEKDNFIAMLKEKAGIKE